MNLHVNGNIARLRCSLSGQEYPASILSRPVGLCRCCPPPGRPLLVEYDAARVSAELPGKLFPARSQPGMWRFAALLPVLGVPPGYAEDVGETPTQHNAALSAELKVEAFLKQEGANPSGSFKDRGLAVAVALGKACGAERFCLPTQGNAGVAACLFSARLGLPGCVVYMPESCQDSIYHRSCELFGGEVRFFGANIAVAATQMRTDLKNELASGAVVELSTFFEPGRLEGKKTMGLEIAEQLGGAELPDLIFYPTGGGTGLVGIWKALKELRELGLLGVGDAHLPRMVAVQSTHCAPVVEAFRAGLDQVRPVQSRGTIADGLNVPAAIMGHAMLAVLRESSGTAVAVSEEQIVAAFRRYGELGVNASYEAAAALAALRMMRGDGTVAPGARVLLLNTASQLIALARTPLPRG